MAEYIDCTPMPNDALQRAIDYLGALEVAPGRYIWKGQDSRWYSASAEQLQEFDTETDYDDVSAVQFCSGAPAVMLPAWWTPEQREAVLHPDGTVCTSTNSEHRSFFCVGKRITVNYETGEEVIV